MVAQSNSASGAQNCSFQAVNTTGNPGLYLGVPSVLQAGAALVGSVDPNYFDVWPNPGEGIVGCKPLDTHSLACFT